MRLPSRWFIVIAAVVVACLALAANAIAIAVESPAAGLSASKGGHLPAPPQSSLPSGEHTRSFDILTRVARNGHVRVQETIVQDFGVVPRHGIERIIPLRDKLGEHPVTNLVVSTSQGTPDAVSVKPETDKVTIRVGDANQTLTGAHTYRVAYDIGGMIDSVAGGRSRLAIDAISAWLQTIDSLRYTVAAPAAPTTVGCNQGALHSTAPCGSARRTGNGATFTGTNLPPLSAFTPRLTWPDTVVAPTAGVSSFGPINFLYALIVGLAVAFVGWRYRRRWRQLLSAAQSQLWATFGPDVAGAQSEAYDLTGDPAIEFVPPMGLRPGEVGALAEVDDTTLLTATVVDLAARGAMKITESAGSWTLERRNTDVVLTDDEQAVMTGLFGEAAVTTLDDRGTEMSTLADQLAENLNDDLATRGLAVPGSSAGGLRSTAHQASILVLGIAAVIAGAILHVIVVTATGDRTAAIALETLLGVVAVLGIGSLLVRGAARGLTPMGLAASWRVRGFNRFFTQSEAMHDRAAADRGLLRQYMGYAIVFGFVTQWIAAFDAPDTSDWFASSSPMNVALLGFTASSLWSPPPSSSSSGFGGGGGGAGGGSGGGGGGSW
jgi:hypothetical protein